MQHAMKPLLWLAVASIVLPAFAAWAQKDLKRTFAYSSINHLGYCVLGVCVAAQFTGTDPAMATEKAAALTGVMLQMFSHGLTAAALFWFIALLERRSGGLRGLDDFGGLRRVVPVFSGLMGIAIFASLGLPGLNGFPAEFLIFKGAFPLAPRASSIAVLGLLMTAVFLLTVIQKVFSGPGESEVGEDAGPDHGRALGARSGHRADAGARALSATDHRRAAWHGDAVGDGDEVLMLAWTIYISFIGALAARLSPSKAIGA